MPADPSLNQRLWILQQPDPDRLAAVVGHPIGSTLLPALQNVVARRAAKSEEQIGAFLSPQLKSLSDPFLMPDMEPAVERIFAAIDAGEAITLFGDYDVDGVTSSTLMREILMAYGVSPGVVLPDRQAEGYGVTHAALNRVLEHFPETKLLISIDCGTNSRDEIKTLSDRGIDTIILDHHEPSTSGGMADCVAVVNPKRDDCEFSYLCAVGVVFKVAHALLKRRKVDGFDLKDHIDLVAFGTIADIVPLIEENRLLVKKGLERMKVSTRPGIIALKEVSGVTADKVKDASSVGFQLGPRINAAGRLASAEDALELLTCDDLDVATASAKALDVLNSKRRQVEEKIQEQAFELAQEAMAAEFPPPALVLGNDGWHSGVVGIVASKIQKHFHRPTFIVGFDENGLGKGSGRSISGVSLVDAIDASREHLVKGGGHAMAAGITVEKDHFSAFRDTFVAAVGAVVTPEILRPKLRLDGELPLRDAVWNLLEGLQMVGPFGASNPTPVFLARGVEMLGPPKVMKGGHLRLDVAQNGFRKQMVYFGAPDPEELPSPPWDIAFGISKNVFRNRVSVDLHVRYLRSAGEILEKLPAG